MNTPSRMLTLLGVALIAASVLWLPVPADAAGEQTLPNPWVEVRRREGVVVELRDNGTRTPDSRGTSVVPYRIGLLREVLLELDGYGRRWPYLGQSRLLRRKRDGNALMYCRTKLPFPLSDRDWVMRLSWADSPGQFKLGWESLSSGNQVAPVRGVIRLVQHAGNWDLRSLGPRATQVSYTRWGDFGGLLTQSLRRKAVIEEPVAVIRSLRLSAQGWR